MLSVDIGWFSSGISDVKYQRKETTLSVSTTTSYCCLRAPTSNKCDKRHDADSVSAVFRADLCSLRNTVFIEGHTGEFRLQSRSLTMSRIAAH